MAAAERMRDVEVIAPHFKRRLSGVTTTVIALVPRQRAMGLGIATLGPGLPKSLPRVAWWRLAGCWRRPAGQGRRIWHARRNVEMLAGIVLRDGLRMPLRLVFTSAAQRHHKPFTRWLIGRMDGVVATSRRSGSYLSVPHSVIMHGIDAAAFQAAENSRKADTAMPPACGPYLVGCTGRIRHQKGTDLFVEAMLALLPAFPDWTAVVTGRVTTEHQAFAGALKERIAEAGLTERIRFVGEVDDIRPWYRRMTLFVAPSRNEGFGLTPLEAMASGTAAITSDAGAYSEMIEPGRTGAVVAAGDGDALTAAIRTYFEDPEKALSQGKDAQHHVARHFALDDEAAALIALYRRVGTS